MALADLPDRLTQQIAELEEQERDPLAVAEELYARTPAIAPEL